MNNKEKLYLVKVASTRLPPLNPTDTPYRGPQERFLSRSGPGSQSYHDGKRMPEMTQGTPGAMAGVSAGLVGASRKFDPGDSWSRMSGPHLGTDFYGRPDPNGKITGAWTVNGRPGPSQNVPPPPTAADLKRLNGQSEFVDATPDNKPPSVQWQQISPTQLYADKANQGRNTSRGLAQADVARYR